MTSNNIPEQDMEETIFDLMLKVSVLEEDNRKLTNQISDQTMQILRLTNLVSNCEMEKNSELQDKITNLESSNSEMKSIIESNENTITDLKYQIIAQEDIIDDLRNQLTNESLVVEDLQSQITGQNNVIDDLKDQLTDKEKIIDDLKNQLTNKSSVVKDQQSQITDLMYQIGELEIVEEPTDKSEIINDLRDQLDDKVEIINDLRDELDDKSYTINDLRCQLEYKNRDLQNMDGQLSELADTLTDLKSKNDELSNLIDECLSIKSTNTEQVEVPKCDKIYITLSECRDKILGLLEECCEDTYEKKNYLEIGFWFGQYVGILKYLGLTWIYKSKLVNWHLDQIIHVLYDNVYDEELIQCPNNVTTINIGFNIGMYEAHLGNYMTNFTYWNEIIESIEDNLTSYVKAFRRIYSKFTVTRLVKVINFTKTFNRFKVREILSCL
jgi:predicted RNase H-like nuclease (RuvC/YqgF family)